jgi:hypothetical protein
VSTLSRPALLPGLRPLWRHQHAIQLGTDPAQAVVLELPHPAAAKLLHLLDGSRTERAIIGEMARLGMSEQDVLTVLASLAEAGLVVPASSLMPHALQAGQRQRITGEATALALRFRDRPASPAVILRRRHRSRIVIAGDGMIASLLSGALTEAGVGTVSQATIAEATAMRGEGAFAVHIGMTSGIRNRAPHLAISVRDGVAIVGPLVPESGGPCLICLDLHRTDRDPAWPRLAEQLAEAGPAQPPCASATAMTAAGFAAAEVLAYVDGSGPTTIATTVEINGTAPWRRRSWTPHPACDCPKRRR